MADPLDPGTLPPDPPRRDARPGRAVVCDFCQCKVTGASSDTDGGDIITVGDKAKKYRKLEEENEKLEGTIATLRHENEDLRNKLSERPAPKTRRGVL